MIQCHVAVVVAAFKFLCDWLVVCWSMSMKNLPISVQFRVSRGSSRQNLFHRCDYDTPSSLLLISRDHHDLSLSLAAETFGAVIAFTIVSKDVAYSCMAPIALSNH